MAFPGTYNIRYYQGDLYEFNIYPKTTNGSAFDLTGYSTKFFVATARGTSATQFECLAEISDGAILCKIPGAIGKTLVPGTKYVYDVQIKKSGSPDKIYTLLSGDITVQGDVTRMSGD